jgi:hypothetical protein
MRTVTKVVPPFRKITRIEMTWFQKVKLLFGASVWYETRIDDNLENGGSDVSMDFYIYPRGSRP